MTKSCFDPKQAAPSFAESVEIDFDDVHESWNVYKLKDGTTLKIKIVLKNVRRLPRYNPDGSPQYITQQAILVRAIHIPKTLYNPRTSASNVSAGGIV